MNPLEKAAALLQREFGPDWKSIAAMLGTEDLRRRVGKELTSFMAFPERGTGGDNKWRGNCSPEVVAAVLKYVLDSKKYYGKDTSSFTLLDPMSGSGTSQAVADRFQVRSLLYDLNPTPPIIPSSNTAEICGVLHIRMICPDVRIMKIFWKNSITASESSFLLYARMDGLLFS